MIPIVYKKDNTICLGYIALKVSVKQKESAEFLKNKFPVNPCTYAYRRYLKAFLTFTFF